MKNQRWTLGVALAGVLLCGLPANASLTSFQTFSGAGVNVRTAGWGSVSQSGTISINPIPAGSTILGVFLYTSTFSNSSMAGIGVTIGGVSTASVGGFTNLGTTVSLTAGRADLTSTALATAIAGGTTSFAISETSGLQDGEALVVVYKDPANSAVSTIGILDGFSATSGDTSTINFSTPLNPSDPGFFAEMRIGDGFSCCSQTSTITVNGTVITTNAGNNDDGIGAISDGQLITVGGDNDPFSPFLPTYENDHERYNLVSRINAGDTSISIRTLNPSNNDNIFLEVFAVSGFATINNPSVPEPASIVLFGTLLAGVALRQRRRKA